MDAERPLSQEPSGSVAARAGAALVRAERKRLSRELHDSPVQLLSAAALRLQMATRDGTLVAEAVDAATQDVERAMVALREMMERLASSDIAAEVVEDALTRLETGASARQLAGPVSLEDAAEMVTSAMDAAVEPLEPISG